MYGIFCHNYTKFLHTTAKVLLYLVHLLGPESRNLQLLAGHYNLHIGHR